MLDSPDGIGIYTSHSVVSLLWLPSPHLGRKLHLRPRWGEGSQSRKLVISTCVDTNALWESEFMLVNLCITET